LKEKLDLEEKNERRGVPCCPDVLVLCFLFPYPFHFFALCIRPNKKGGRLLWGVRCMIGGSWARNRSRYSLKPKCPLGNKEAAFRRGMLPRFNCRKRVDVRRFRVRTNNENDVTNFNPKDTVLQIIIPPDNYLHALYNLENFSVPETRVLFIWIKFLFLVVH